MTKELSEGRAIVVRGERFVCTEIFDKYSDSSDYVVAILRRVDSNEKKRRL